MTSVKTQLPQPSIETGLPLRWQKIMPPVKLPLHRSWKRPVGFATFADTINADLLASSRARPSASGAPIPGAFSSFPGNHPNRRNGREHEDHR